MRDISDIGSLSDEELAAKCKRNRLEERIHESSPSVGCLTGIVVALTILVLKTMGVIAWDWCFTIFFAPYSILISFVLIFGLLNFVARFRCRRFLRELERRYGCRPLREYVATARRSIGLDHRVLILTGVGLPIGDRWWICVRLNGNDKSATVETRCGHGNESNFQGTYAFDFGKGLHPKDFFRINRSELPSRVAEELVALSRQIEKSRIRMNSTVLDGFPVSCALISGDTKRVKTISCNLAGIPQKQAATPYAQLVQAVFQAGRELIDRSPMFGSCDSKTGNIRIGDL
jgi:hypothetical protein